MFSCSFPHADDEALGRACDLRAVRAAAPGARLEAVGRDGGDGGSEGSHPLGRSPLLGRQVTAALA